MLVGMQAVGMDRIGAIEGHVVARCTGVIREDHAALVGNRLAIGVGAAHVDDVRVALRGVHELVIPALAGAEVVPCPAGVGGAGARQIEPHRCTRGHIVTALQPGSRRAPGRPRRRTCGSSHSGAL